MASCSGIDVNSESLIQLQEAARHPAFMRGKRPAHISALYRYCQAGSKAVDGQRVRLEVVKCPSGLRTSVEAIERFLYRLTNPGQVSPRLNDKQRKRQLDQAEAELAAAGV